MHLMCARARACVCVCVCVCVCSFAGAVKQPETRVTSLLGVRISSSGGFEPSDPTAAATGPAAHHTGQTSVFCTELYIQWAFLWGDEQNSEWLR